MSHIPNNFLGLEKSYSDYRTARVAVLPLPYEATTSYGKGTRLGPAAIIRASQTVEMYDEELDEETFRRFGIATLPPVKFGNKRGAAAMDLIATRVRQILKDGKMPVCLGGEHTVSYGIVKAFTEREGDFSVLQIDAHSDLRDSYEGTPWSHASVMKRIWEINPHIVQTAIRAQCREERAFIVKNRIHTFYDKDIHESADWIGRVLAALKERVYITVDCDGIDPAIIPATGTPEPGGLTWRETVALMRNVCREKTVIGFDVVELAPNKETHHSQDFLAKLAYKMMGYIFTK